MSVVYDYNDFPINNLHFNDPLKTSGGSYIGKSYIKKSHSKKETDFYIQLPKLVCSNISLNHPDSRNYIEFELHARNLELYDFISAIDDRNITMAFRNSDTWFQQSLSMDTIDDFYRSIIKPKRGMKPPSFKIRVPTQKGNIMVPTYNEKKQLVDLKNVNPQDELSVIVQIVGLRFMKQQFICELNLIQAKHYPVSNMPQDYLFLDGNKKNALSPIDMIDLDTLSLDEEISHPTVYLDQHDETDKETVELEQNVEENIKEADNLLTQEKQNLDINQEENIDNASTEIIQEPIIENKDKEIVQDLVEQVHEEDKVDQQDKEIVQDLVEQVHEEDKEIVQDLIEQVHEEDKVDQQDKKIVQDSIELNDKDNFQEEIEVPKVDSPTPENIQDENNNIEIIKEDTTRLRNIDIDIEELTKEEPIINIKEESEKESDINQDILGMEQENLLDIDNNDNVDLRLDQEKTEKNNNSLENNQIEETTNFENNLLDTLNITEKRETTFPKKETEIITIKEDYEKDIEMVEEEILNLQQQMEKLQLEQSKKKEKLRKLQSDQVETEFEYEL